MRLKRFKVIFEVMGAFLGAGMLVVAFYAYNLKLDNNPTMGSQRKVLALLGVICLVLVLGGIFSRKIRALGKITKLQNIIIRFEHALDWIGRSAVVKWIDRAREKAQKSWLGRLIAGHPEIWAITGALLVIFISYWYITSGSWTWSPYSTYFDKQADAYLSGSLALLEKPPAELLSLANPYDYHNREGLGYLWDASLYQGKFYLYWGPVPALIAAAVKLLHPGVVEDQYLLMFFMAGLAIALTALLSWLWKTFFPDSPAWTVFLLTLIGGLSAPVLWLINRPNVYETAIAGGEFFLVLGVYAALRGMASDNSKSWLAAAGLAWGASVGCRVNNAVAVIWLAGLTALYILSRAKKTGRWVTPVVCLVAPLFVWAAGLGWYNLARFGSLLETGHRYQLTGPALPAVYSQVVSIHYIVPNAYNYLFRPLLFAWKDFPFVFASFLTEKMWPWFIRLPEHYYYSEPVAGIFLSIPIFWLVTLPILRPLRAGWDWVNERSIKTRPSAQLLLPWVCWMLAGATLCNLGALLVFISSTMRYLADVVPLLTVVVGLCIWWSMDFFRPGPGWRRLILIVFVVLGLVSVLIGLFVNFHAGDYRFEANNPHLYEEIARFFTRIL